MTGGIHYVTSGLIVATGGADISVELAVPASSARIDGYHASGGFGAIDIDLEGGAIASMRQNMAAEVIKGHGVVVSSHGS